MEQQSPPVTAACDNTAGKVHSAVLTNSSAQNSYITCLTLSHTFTPTAEEVAADSNLTAAFLDKDLDDSTRVGFETLVHLDAPLLAREFKQAQACGPLSCSEKLTLFS